MSRLTRYLQSYLVAGTFPGVVVLDDIPRLIARPLYSLDDTGAMGYSIFGPTDWPILDMIALLVVSHFCLSSVLMRSI